MFPNRNAFLSMSAAGNLPFGNPANRVSVSAPRRNRPKQTFRQRLSGGFQNALRPVHGMVSKMRKQYRGSTANRTMNRLFGNGANVRNRRARNRRAASTAHTTANLRAANEARNNAAVNALVGMLNAKAMHELQQKFRNRRTRPRKPVHK